MMQDPIPGRSMDEPVDVKVARDEASMRKSQAAHDEARRIHERNRAADEARERAQARADAAREAELREERLQMAREQAEADKRREYERYVSAGGDPDQFSEDYPHIRRVLIAHRIAEQDSRLATPQSYKNGLGGSHVQPLKSVTPPSQAL